MIAPSSGRPRRGLKFVLGLLFVLASGAVRAWAGSGLAPETFTLANGLTVVVLPDRRAPVVTQMVWYRAGAADDMPGKSGIAHFLEHLMFRGTAKVPDGQFSKIVAKNGGQENAFTTRDYTGYYQNMAVDRLPLVMELEADRMLNLALTDQVVTTERKVIIEERRMRTDNEPASLLGEQINAALHLSHPYALPTIGWLKEMEGLERTDAEAFYRRFYTPANAILVLAGDVTAKGVRPLVEKTFGALKGAPAPVRIRPSAPPQIAARRLVLKDARAPLALIQREYVVPSYTNAKPGEAEALEIAADILGGGETSRLYRRLVIEKGLATAAGAWYSGSAVNDTEFGVYARPRAGVAPEAVEAELDAVLAEFAAQGPSAGELERSKAQMTAAAIYVRDSQFGMARMFGEGLTTGQSIADIVEWPERIMAVKPERVTGEVKGHLLIERSVTGLLLPMPGAKAKPVAGPPVVPGSGIVH